MKVSKPAVGEKETKPETEQQDVIVRPPSPPPLKEPDNATKTSEKKEEDEGQISDEGEAKEEGEAEEEDVDSERRGNSMVPIDKVDFGEAARHMRSVRFDIRNRDSF
jgi:hypothetical protein